MTNNLLTTLIIMILVSVVFKSGRGIGFREGQQSIIEAIKILTAIPKKEEKLTEDTEKL